MLERKTTGRTLKETGALNCIRKESSREDACSAIFFLQRERFRDAREQEELGGERCGEVVGLGRGRRVAKYSVVGGRVVMEVPVVKARWGRFRSRASEVGEQHCDRVYMDGGC